MAFTPREELIIKTLLIEGKTMPELRRILIAKNKEDAQGLKPAPMPPERVKQLLAKIGRKALHYSEHFEKSRSLHS